MTGVEQLERAVQEKDLKRLRDMVKETRSADENAVMAVVLLEWLGLVTPRDQLFAAFDRLHEITRLPVAKKPRLRIVKNDDDEKDSSDG